MRCPKAQNQQYGGRNVPDLRLSAQIEQGDLFPRENTSMHVIPKLVQITPIQLYSRAAPTSRSVLL
ncbi:hypothetical protein BFJ69_g8303 [Fusarium oxysporum]|uniref:Uncharacterized protein n=1 Tax=Fusarium oxysporum TaxID=5507 RepID=A0A420N392_FUSOX|nr:hypothetical protein BFJ69_g8303 [Fusarium oxysporum]